jgi:two-component system sensor histidine kinase KdpD
VVPALAGATFAIGALQEYLGVPNASALYLAAVVASAFLAGTSGAIVASIASFLLYDFLFIQPLYTFTVRDPGEWLNLILLLFVGIVVGQLAAVQRARTEDARAREREARGLFMLSRVLATRESTSTVLPEIAGILREQTRFDRVSIALGPDDAQELVVADTAARADRSADRSAVPVIHRVLRRTPGDTPAEWVRVHKTGAGRASQASAALYRIRIEAGQAVLGSVWAERAAHAQEPDRTENRLLAAAADQIGQVLAHDRLVKEAQAAEVARQSDALKSALLQSVSHDLRTPLATIRAAAGTLRPGLGVSAADQEESAEAIDREVEYLNRLVTNLLDLSRIEAGALRAERDVFVLEDLVERTTERFRLRLGDRPLEVAVDVPPVVVDPVFLDEAITNALENGLKYTQSGTPIRITARELADEPLVRLTIEDAGPGVPDESVPRLFEKFYRVPGGGQGSRSGTGIGLAVVQGLVEAMGGHVGARRSDLGGLAIDLDLPLAPTNREAAPALAILQSTR